MLVEDDPVLAAIIVSIVEDAGDVVIVTPTAADAIALLQVVTVDLVITDVVGPSVDATLDANTDIQCSAQGTPVVMLSAHPMALDAARAAGFRAVIPKPFDLDDFVHQVYSLMTVREVPVYTWPDLSGQEAVGSPPTHPGPTSGRR